MCFSSEDESLLCNAELGEAWLCGVGSSRGTRMTAVGWPYAFSSVMD